MSDVEGSEPEVEDRSEHEAEDDGVANIFDVMYKGLGEEIDPLSEEFMGSFHEELTGMMELMDEEDSKEIDISIVNYSNEDINVCLIVHKGVAVRLDWTHFPTYTVKKLALDGEKKEMLIEVLKYFKQNYGNLGIFSRDEMKRFHQYMKKSSDDSDPKASIRNLNVFKGYRCEKCFRCSEKRNLQGRKCVDSTYHHNVKQVHMQRLMERGEFGSFFEVTVAGEEEQASNGWDESMLAFSLNVARRHRENNEKNVDGRKMSGFKETFRINRFWYSKIRSATVMRFEGRFDSNNFVALYQACTRYLLDVHVEHLDRCSYVVKKLLVLPHVYLRFRPSLAESTDLPRQDSLDSRSKLLRYFPFRNLRGFHEYARVAADFIWLLLKAPEELFVGANATVLSDVHQALNQLRRCFPSLQPKSFATFKDVNEAKRRFRCPRVPADVVFSSLC